MQSLITTGLFVWLNWIYSLFVKCFELTCYELQQCIHRKWKLSSEVNRQPVTDFLVPDAASFSKHTYPGLRAWLNMVCLESSLSLSKIAQMQIVIDICCMLPGVLQVTVWFCSADLLLQKDSLWWVFSAGVNKTAYDRIAAVFRSSLQTKVRFFFLHLHKNLKYLGSSFQRKSLTTINKTLSVVIVQVMRFYIS